MFCCPGKEKDMIVFCISNVSIFLEPPSKLLPEYMNSIVIGAGISLEDIPGNFFEDAGKALSFDWQLDSYLKSQNPNIQLVERFEDSTFQNIIAGQAHTKNMWDCCYSIFDTKIAANARISVLAEYELDSDPDFSMKEQDYQFLFIEWKKRYLQELTEYKSTHVNCSNTESISYAWSRVCQDMLEIYGIPANQMERFARDGSKKWGSLAVTNTSAHVLSSIRPYPHSPEFHYISAKPKENKYKYFTEVKVRR
jgi:hypothetical protein